MIPSCPFSIGIEFALDLGAFENLTIWLPSDITSDATEHEISAVDSFLDDSELGSVQITNHRNTG